jgi:8-oxo-dGTP pyrophosphatase MutT (NUDIX family)
MPNKPNNYYAQSAVLPLKKENGEYYILLITSRNKNKWVIPKGIIEEHLTPRESAEKEAFEEAGIKGNTHKNSIGIYKYKKWGGICEVEVYPFTVKSESDEWPEMAIRKRKWFPINKALKKINNKQLEILIKKYLNHNSK